MTFEFADPSAAFSAVRLWQEVRIPGDRLDFVREGNSWVLTLDRPPVSRMEYLFEVTDLAGDRAMITDPANPRQVDGAFGVHSVVEFPGYQVPGWLDAPAVDGEWSAIGIPSRALKADIDVRLWSPAGTAAGTALPLLVANDGPEYDMLSGLSQYTAASIASGALPPHRLALLTPGDRDQWYSCSTAYASALATAVLPALRRRVVTRGRPVGMGTSLGALAMLHAQRRHPATFGGLFLQSGSFFTPRYDRHEARFGRYVRIVRFVGDVLRADSARECAPVAMTCGAIEENLDNNRLMAAALSGQGYEVRLAEVPDMHNHTAWRDAFDPYLTDLLTHVWSAGFPRES